MLEDGKTITIIQSTFASKGKCVVGYLIKNDSDIFIKTYLYTGKLKWYCQLHSTLLIFKDYNFDKNWNLLFKTESRHISIIVNKGLWKISNHSIKGGGEKFIIRSFTRTFLPWLESGMIIVQPPLTSAKAIRSLPKDTGWGYVWECLLNYLVIAGVKEELALTKRFSIKGNLSENGFYIKEII